MPNDEHPHSFASSLLLHSVKETFTLIVVVGLTHFEDNFHSRAQSGQTRDASSRPVRNVCLQSVSVLKHDILFTRTFIYIFPQILSWIVITKAVIPLPAYFHLSEQKNIFMFLLETSAFIWMTEQGMTEDTCVECGWRQKTPKIIDKIIIHSLLHLHDFSCTPHISLTNIHHHASQPITYVSLSLSLPSAMPCHSIPRDSWGDFFISLIPFYLPHVYSIIFLQYHLRLP